MPSACCAAHAAQGGQAPPLLRPGARQVVNRSLLPTELRVVSCKLHCNDSRPHAGKDHAAQKTLRKHTIWLIQVLQMVNDVATHDFHRRCHSRTVAVSRVVTGDTMMDASSARAR